VIARVLALRRLSALVFTAAVCTSALVASVSAFAEDARVDYMLECQGCHLQDGSGAPGQVPDLRGSIGRFVSVAGGRAYLIQVPGSAHSPLSDAALAEVLNWMILRFGPTPPDFDRFTAEEVSLHRREPLVAVEERREGLLRALAQQAPE